MKTVPADQLVLGMPVHPRWSNPNPAVAKWGFGPTGVKCGSCEHLFCSFSNGRKKFYKCRKRGEVEGITAGPGTDHRVRWDACKKYQPEIKEQGNA